MLPLVLLAILSVVGGWVGVPGSLGGRTLRQIPRPGLLIRAALNAHHEVPAPPVASSREGQEPSRPRRNHLTGLGLAGFLGLFLAWLLYANATTAATIAASLGSFYHAVLNKYYVDEIYRTLFVKPLIDGSTSILWHGVDQGVIDASVNGTADGAREVSDSLRHMQSGNLRSYAGWIAAGAAAVIAYMIWMGTR